MRWAHRTATRHDQPYQTADYSGRFVAEVIHVQRARLSTTCEAHHGRSDASIAHRKHLETSSPRIPRRVCGNDVGAQMGGGGGRCGRTDYRDASMSCTRHTSATTVMPTQSSWWTTTRERVELYSHSKRLQSSSSDAFRQRRHWRHEGLVEGEPRRRNVSRVPGRQLPNTRSIARRSVTGHGRDARSHAHQTGCGRD